MLGQRDTQQAEGPVADIIGRWLALSELERRAFGALARELTVSSELVEQSTLDLSERFQTLAGVAQAQVGRMDRIVQAASALEVDGVAVPLDAALQTVETTLVKAIETILFVSKHAMRMVFTLQDVARDVAGAEQCSGQIEVINRQARYLALNAAIEATRSGAAGGAFNVIAQEMKELSKKTEETAAQVRTRIAAVAAGVQAGHNVLQEIATLDLSDSILAKERIGSVLAGITAQHATFGVVLADAASASSDMAATVGGMITGMQFQDRTKQTLAQVVETLGVLQECEEQAQAATRNALPALAVERGPDEAALRMIIEKQTLGGMKSRLLERLLHGDSAEIAGGGERACAQPSDDAGGDIELF